VVEVEAFFQAIDADADSLLTFDELLHHFSHRSLPPPEPAESAAAEAAASEEEMLVGPAVRRPRCASGRGHHRRRRCGRPISSWVGPAPRARPGGGATVGSRCRAGAGNAAGCGGARASIGV
jgi:hypothetical protein